MGLHKLTAGDGYTYLTRQVAAHDSTEKGRSSLRDYYSERGESPGQWLGAGLEGLAIGIDDPITEAQMKSLFGEGRHPNADRLADAVIAAGGNSAQALVAGTLGRPFNVYDGAPAFQVQVAREFTAYNRGQGVAWNAPIKVEERARIRSGAATRMFTAELSRPPEDARELAGFVARASRQATTAVAGYDLTFSPVKSVSTLWALAPRDVAEQIQRAHDAAVADTVGWLEREAVFTRVGHAGSRQVATRGLVATSTHRDTRAGDPDLHTHLALSNKVQTLNGRWLALDGRVLYKANVAASERYNTRLEGELIARLGVTFDERESGEGRRPIRAIVGINPLLNRCWSSRRRDIEVRRSALAADFQSRHGRPPTAVEAIAIAQQATLETRDAKHYPRSQAEQRTSWRQQAEDVLGGPGEVDAMIDRALGGAGTGPSAADTWVSAAAMAVLAKVEESRAVWQVWHVRAEA
jgi:conjugative relaxase-like TrwC/TraI family protein